MNNPKLRMIDESQRLRISIRILLLFLKITLIDKIKKVNKPKKINSLKNPKNNEPTPAHCVPLIVI
jgi:hypothetical protein